MPAQWCWGGVFVSPAPAYADGYVSPDGNIYYGYKSDANYSKDRIKIEVHYYSNEDDAANDRKANQDPLGKFVHVKYTANLSSKDNSFDKWAFRPMWWYGVPAGLTNVHNINYSRFEKYTGNGKPVAPSTSQGPNKDSDNVTKHYANSKDWKSISRFYVEDPSQLKSMNGLGMLLGIDGYDTNGTTAGNWEDFYAASKGMQGMFIDWESAGKRFYEMDYVAELTDKAWKDRDEHPLRFAAGVYRFAGNWHIATGQIHRAPKIADSLKNVQYPALTTVSKADDLNDTEKTSVENAIKTANKDTKHFTDLLEKIEVAKDGTATLTFHDNTTIKMPGKLLVVEDKKDNVKFPPVYPAPVGVVNPQKLSDADQQAIIKGFKDANKGKEFLSKVSTTDSDVYKFDNNKQELTITYTDGSTITVPYSSLVYQGATIADWAPYVVPDAIEVDDLTKLKQDEINKIIKAFDDANKGITPYDEARKGNGDKAPVEVSANGDVTITWKDGSKTTIAAWQFLKQKPKTTPSPEPQPPAPKPAEEKKTFTVEFSDSTKRSVPKFDPFNASSADENTKNAVKAVKNQFIALKAKDSDGKAVTITDVEFDFDNGKVIFKAGESYKDQSYPMPLLFKKGSTGTQNPTPQTPTSKTDIDQDEAKNTFTYNVRKIETDGDKPTVQEAVKALKQFVRDNYDNVSDSDLQNVTSDVAVGANWKPKANTKNMGSYLASGDNAGPITSFSIDNTNGYAITVHGHPWDPDADNGPDWNSSLERGLFTIQASDLYVKKGNTQQTPTDNTIEKLRELAKQIRNQRKNAGELPEDAITTLKATDTDIDGMTDEKALRDLIKKISDYQKPKPVEYTYNFEKLTLDHEGDPNDADYKKIVVEKFLKKNYTTTDNTNWTTLENAYAKNAAVLSGNNVNTYNLTPVTSGTSGLNIYTGDKQAGGVTSVGIDSNGNLVVRGWKAGSKGSNAEELIRIKKADLYTPKSKEQNPTPSADDLEKLKKQAKEIIDRNPKLTDDQKTEYEQKIKNAKNKEEIQNILKEANEKAGKNTVTPEQLKEKEKKDKENKENEQKEKDKKEREEDKKKKQDQQLKDDKKKASDAIDNLDNLTQEEKDNLKKEINGGGTQGDSQGATTSEAVQKILDDAKNLNEAREVVKVGELPFLDHGNASDDKKSETSHADDVALHELLGGTSGKDQTLTDLENALAKKDPAATAQEIKNALDAAKRQNTSNEQNAKNAGIAKLEAKKADLVAAYNALTSDQQTQAKKNYDAAITAITNAESAVNSATKPSDIMTAVNGVDTSLNAAKEDIKNNTPKRDTSQNTYDDQSELNKEKEAQKKRINDSDLPDADKQKAIDDINNAKKIGDPEGIANRYLKHQKIEDAKKQIAALDHLNKAQKKYYEDLLDSTDASDHADGKDDIDDALEQAKDTDTAMKFLGDLKKQADTFKTTDKYTGATVDSDKKSAFDKALQAAEGVLDKETGDPKSSVEVNELYNDLLQKMKALDNNASAGATVDSTALQEEVGKENTVKASDGYKYSDQTKQTAYTDALSTAKTVLTEAQGDLSKKSLEELQQLQQKVDDALAKLKAAEAALDGKEPTPTPTPTPTPEPAPSPSPSPSVDKSHLQQGINGSDDVHNSDEYNNAPSDKKQAYDHALDHANEVNNDPNATQDQVNQAAEDLKKAENDLKPTPSPLPTPVPGGHEDSGFGVNDNEPTTVDKGELNVQIQGAESDSQPGNAGNSNAGSNNAGNAANSGANSGNAGNAANNNAANKNASNANNANAANSAAVNAAVESSPAVKQADAQVSKAQAALDVALAEAKKVAADPNATQAQVDAASQKLADARKSLAAAQDYASKVRAVVREQVLKRVKGSKLSKTGSDVSVFGMFAAGVAAAGAALFVSKRRGISRHCSK